MRLAGQREPKGGWDPDRAGLFELSEGRRQREAWAGSRQARWEGAYSRQRRADHLGWAGVGWGGLRVCAQESPEGHMCLAWSPTK